MEKSAKAEKDWHNQARPRPATVPARSDTALVTSYAYDTAGRVQDVTDPNGITARTLYDALGRTTASIANFTGAASGSQTDVTTLFSFDTAGRLASRTAVQPTGTPSQTTGYVYGVSPSTGSTIASNDLMAETRYPDPVTGQPSATERDIYTSNALGERTAFSDRAGTTHTYAYDVTGRQTADAITVLGTGVDGAVRRIESAYDALGRVTGVTSFSAPGGSTAVNQVTRGYNGFGQLTSEWQSHTGLVDPATAPRVQYAYSQGVRGNHSRLTRITYPDAYAVDYAYVGIDNTVSRPTSLSGQQAGSTTSVTLEAFKYLGVGTVIERSRPEVNVTLSMVNFSGATADAGDKYTGLDRFGRVADQRWTQGTTATSPVLDRYGYTYDRNSNRLTRSNALAAAFSETYAYDALNQLQSFSRGDTPTPTTSQQWQFDALGNWTTVTTNGVAQARTANAQNELTQVGSSSLAYSRTGNLTTDAEGRTLAYDAWNRLVRVTSADGLTWTTHAYDGLNRRVTETVAPGPVTTTRDLYYSQDWQVLEERVRTPAGAIPTTADTRFVWSPVYVDAMIARDRNADGNTTTGTGGLEQRVYAIQDANWHTTAIIAAAGVPGVAAGTVINRFAYTPYGESQTLTASWTTPPAGSTPAVPWAHLFQGLKFNALTGLAYVRHRDYSASLGRFIELDPIGFDAGDNNWYRFVGNGPTGKVDPSGLETILTVSGAHNSNVTGSASLPSPYTLLNDFGAAPSPDEVQRRLDCCFPSPCTQGDLWADNKTPYQRYRSELANKMRYGSHSQRVAAINESFDQSWRYADISPGYRATIDLFRPQGYQPGIGGSSNFELIVQASLAGAATARGLCRAPISARQAAWDDFREAAEGRPYVFTYDRNTGRVTGLGTGEKGGPTIRPKPDGSYSVGKPGEILHYRPIPGGAHTVNQQ